MELRAQGESLKGCGRHPARGAEWAVVAGAGSCSLLAPQLPPHLVPAQKGRDGGRVRGKTDGEERQGGEGGGVASA